MIIFRSINESHYTAGNIAEIFINCQNKQSFFRFMENTIVQLKRLGREQTAENYTATLKSFMRFRKNSDVLLDEINSDLMMEYETYLKSNGIAMKSMIDKANESILKKL